MILGTGPRRPGPVMEKMMKRTTWLTRVLAVFAAILVSLGIWTAVDGTAPTTTGTTSGTVVTDSSFSQTDDFLTRNAPVTSQNAAPSQATRYRTRAS